MPVFWKFSEFSEKCCQKTGRGVYIIIIKILKIPSRYVVEECRAELVRAALNEFALKFFVFQIINLTIFVRDFMTIFEIKEEIRP